MTITGSSAATVRRGGRGARERILSSARELFYRNGIRNTGVELLAEHAHVSKRTLYQHFPSKDQLVVAYLRDIAATGGTRPQQNLAVTGSARDRLLSVFDIATDGRIRYRGCPFHNAAVEAADDMPDARELVESQKREFTDRLSGIAAEAGAADPAKLGRQLAVLLEGATALATSLNDTAPLLDAHEMAELLIDLAC